MRPQLKTASRASKASELIAVVSQQEVNGVTLFGSTFALTHSTSPSSCSSSAKRIKEGLVEGDGGKKTSCQGPGSVPV